MGRKHERLPVTYGWNPIKSTPPSYSRFSEEEIGVIDFIDEVSSKISFDITYDIKKQIPFRDKNYVNTKKGTIFTNIHDVIICTDWTAKYYSKNIDYLDIQDITCEADNDLRRLIVQTNVIDGYPEWTYTREPIKQALFTLFPPYFKKAHDEAVEYYEVNPNDINFTDLHIYYPVPSYVIEENRRRCERIGKYIKSVFAWTKDGEYKI